MNSMMHGQLRPALETGFCGMRIFTPQMDNRGIPMTIFRSGIPMSGDGMAGAMIYQSRVRLLMQSISITEHQGQHIIQLTQENIPTDEESKINFYLGCQTGWTFYLTNLKSIFEGGKDLRNKNEGLTNMLNS
jgi:hypothetical protein